MITNNLFTKYSDPIEISKQVLELEEPSSETCDLDLNQQNKLDYKIFQVSPPSGADEFSANYKTHNIVQNVANEKSLGENYEDEIQPPPLPVSIKPRGNYYEPVKNTIETQNESKSITTPLAQIRQRRTLLSTLSKAPNPSSIEDSSNYSPVLLPPTTKPRVTNINLYEKNKIDYSIQNRSDILDDLIKTSSIPETKPRMKPTRLLDKYMTKNESHPPPPTKVEQSAINNADMKSNLESNPLPKPRTNMSHSIEVNNETIKEELITEEKKSLPIEEIDSDIEVDNDDDEEEELSKYTNNLTDSGHQSTDVEAKTDESIKRLISQNIQLSYFKTSLVKSPLNSGADTISTMTSTNTSNENKLSNFLMNVRPTPSSTSSSSSSVLSNSSSPRSDQTNTNTSSSLSSQAIVSYSSISSSSYKSNQSPKKSPKIESNFVSQMKNIFESNQLNAGNKPLSVNENKFRKNKKTSEPTNPSIDESPRKQSTQQDDLYMNVSNKYLMYLKTKQSDDLEQHEAPPPPPSIIPPLPPSFSPPSSPPPSPPSSPPLQLSMSPPKNITNENLVARLIADTPDLLNKDTNVLNETNTITTLTTTTTTLTSISSNQALVHSINKSNQRLMSSTSSNTNITSEFRILSQTHQHSSDRSTTPSNKSIGSISQSNFNLNPNGHQQLMINHIPDSVDLVNFEYEGQRRVIVPGFMTSADILRNMLLSNNAADQNSAKTPIIIQRQQTMTLKEKLMLQNKANEFNDQTIQLPSQVYQRESVQPANYRLQHESIRQTCYQKPAAPQLEFQPIENEIAQTNLAANVDDEDAELAKKFARSNGRIRSMSGVVALDLLSSQTNQIIDIDLDYEEHDNQDQFVDESAYNEEPERHVITNNFDYSTFETKEQLIERPHASQKEMKPSIRITQLLNATGSNNNGSSRMSSRRLASINKQGVTGSFDPSDFDSFDEEEDFIDPTGQVVKQTYIPMEPMQKIREHALLQQQIDEEREKQQRNLVQFDPEDFDSFNEEDEQLQQQQHAELPVLEFPIENPQSAAMTPMIEQEADSNEEEFTETTSNDELSQLNERQRRQTEFISNRNRIEAIFKSNNQPQSNTSNQTHAKVLASPQVEYKHEEEESCSPSSEINAQEKFDIEEQVVQEPTKQINQSNNGQNNNNNSNFFRSALDRISNRSRSKSKTRSSSVPLRTLISNLEMTPAQPQQQSEESPNGKIANMKTLHLMNKMQTEFDEKQKRKKQRREQQQRLLADTKSKSTATLPTSSTKSSTKSTTDRKFLSSIMNTLFSTHSTSSSSSSDPADSMMQKNEAKRLSLRKLKAKDKAKKKGDYAEAPYPSPEEEVEVQAQKHADTQDDQVDFKKSSRSLNFMVGYDEDGHEECIDTVNQFIRSTSFDTGSLSKLASQPFKPSSIGTTSIGTRFGKIKNESNEKPLNENNKENLMKQLKAELDEEIKDRRLIELKQNIINGTDSDASSNHRKSTAFEDLSSYESDKPTHLETKSSTLNRRSLKDSSFNKDSTDTNIRKIRSKSVTFLDEISSEETSRQNSNLSHANQKSSDDYSYSQVSASPHESRSQPNGQAGSYSEYKTPTNEPIGQGTSITPSSTRKISLKSGDVRLMCGALTGAGPIRSIMKKSATDLSITLNSPSLTAKTNQQTYENKFESILPRVQLGQPHVDEHSNAPRKSMKSMQSDL